MKGLLSTEPTPSSFSLSQLIIDNITVIFIPAIMKVSIGMLLIPYHCYVPENVFHPILCQDVEEDWPLQIFDHQGRPHEILLKPGEMVWWVFFTKTIIKIITVMMTTTKGGDGYGDRHYGLRDEKS